jgi:hypothetical protein
MYQQKWQIPADVPTPPQGSSTFFFDSTNNGAFSCKMSNGVVVSISTPLDNGGRKYIADSSLNDTHIGRCMMFDFATQKAMLTQATGGRAGVKYKATIQIKNGFNPPTPAEWVIEFTGNETDGDYITIDLLNGSFIDLYAKVSPNQPNEFAIGTTANETAQNFFSALQALGSGSFCYAVNASGSQVRLLMSTMKSHIGSLGNTWSIINSSSSINYWIDVYGADNDWMCRDYKWFSISNNSGMVTDSLYVHDLCRAVSNETGTFVVRNSETFPVNALALSNMLVVYMQKHSSLFATSQPISDGNDGYYVEIEALDLEDQSLHQESIYPTSTKIEIVSKQPELPALVQQPFIGVLTAISNGEATVEISEVLKIVLANSVHSYDSELNIDNENDFNNRILTPYNDGKCVLLSDLFTNNAPEQSFFSWLDKIGTVLYPITPIVENVENQIIYSKRILFTK